MPSTDHHALIVIYNTVRNKREHKKERGPAFAARVQYSKVMLLTPPSVATIVEYLHLLTKSASIRNFLEFYICSCSFIIFLLFCFLLLISIIMNEELSGVGRGDYALGELTIENTVLPQIHRGPK